MRKVFTTLFAVTVLVALAVNASAAWKKVDPNGKDDFPAPGVIITNSDRGGLNGGSFYEIFGDGSTAGTLQIAWKIKSVWDFEIFDTAEVIYWSIGDINELWYNFVEASTCNCEENGCDWDEGVVTEPTCTIGGYTTYTCLCCGEVEIDDFVAALGHDFSQSNFDTNGVRKCIRFDECGATQTKGQLAQLIFENLPRGANGAIIVTNSGNRSFVTVIVDGVTYIFEGGNGYAAAKTLVIGGVEFTVNPQGNAGNVVVVN